MHIVILAAVAALLASGVVSRYRSVSGLEEINYSGPTGQCYEGTIHSGPWGEPPIQGEFMTQSVCRYECLTGYRRKFFSLTDGDKCFCENDPISDKLLDMSNCMVKSCPGDPRQACGSASATIYFDMRDSRPVLMPTGPETDKYNYHYEGCYLGRSLVGHSTVSNSHMTPSYCGQICRRKDYMNKTFEYFGLMDRETCHCGHKIYKGAFKFVEKSGRPDLCRRGCPGTRSSAFEKHCGSDGVMALYKFGKA